MKRRRVWFVLGGLFLLLLAFEAWDVLGPGILVVRVRNVGHEAIDGAQLETLRSSATIGHLSPGESKLLGLTDLAEGTLWVRGPRDVDGRADSVEVPIYLLNSTKGIVLVDLDRGKPVSWKKYMSPWWDF